MAIISARTLQVLYIIRQRALQGQTTRATDIGTFIAERRKSAPSLYTQAYMSPTSVDDLLSRMSLEYKLVSVSNGEYQLEVQGSAMADLMRDIDACSDHFTENYKEIMVHAAIIQRAEITSEPPDQRVLASMTGVSFDSVRRGLAALIEKNIITEHQGKGGRLSYTLKSSAPQAPTQSALPSVLGALEDSPEPVVPTQNALQAILEDFERNEDLIPLSAVLGDQGPDVEIPAAIVTQEPVDEDGEIPTEEVAPKNPEDGYDPENDIEVVGDRAFRDRYQWSSVEPYIQNKFIMQAKAAGLDLDNYMRYLCVMAQRKIRRAVIGRKNQTTMENLNQEEINSLREVANVMAKDTAYQKRE